tara:strand:- start:3464 stop:4189 length:726 start_codon:yes stop_codon:yes gene_type:complete
MDFRNFFIFKKKIKEILYQLKKKNLTNKKIIVIGNSKKCLDHKIGLEIDKFDIVVRFNAAPTIGYEQFVGTKTDVVVCNELVFNNKLDELAKDFNREGIQKNFIKNQKNKMIFAILENKKNINELDYQKIAGKNDLILFGNELNHILRYMISSNFNYINKLYYYKFGKKLSAGLIFISIMQLLNIKPYIFGFDLDKNNNSYLSYYSKSNVTLSSDHDFFYEKSLINKFLNEKKIFDFSESK